MAGPRSGPHGPEAGRHGTPPDLARTASGVIVAAACPLLHRTAKRLRRTARAHWPVAVRPTRRTAAMQAQITTRGVVEETYPMGYDRRCVPVRAFLLGPPPGERRPHRGGAPRLRVLLRGVLVAATAPWLHPGEPVWVRGVTTLTPSAGEPLVVWAERIGRVGSEPDRPDVCGPAPPDGPARVTRDDAGANGLRRGVLRERPAARAQARRRCSVR